MSYYLTKLEFCGSIKKKNVEKLSEDFFHYFKAETDANGNIVDIYSEDRKYNFEDVIAENKDLFEPGSFFEMCGEEGNYWRWYINPNVDWGYDEVSGYVLFPSTEEDEEKVKALKASLTPHTLSTENTL